MSEPGFSVEGVLDALAMLPRRRDGAGRAIMFVAARGCEHAAGAARAVALAGGPGAVYAIDLDMRRNALAKALSADGAFGPRMDGALNGARFYTVRNVADPAPAFFYHRVGATRVYAGVFDTRALPNGARVGISEQPDYWDQARACGAFAVVDAPALDQSSIALRVAQHMDGVVLTVGAGPGSAPAALAARDQLLRTGASLMGLIYTGADAPAVAIDRMLRHAG